MNRQRISAAGAGLAVLVAMVVATGSGPATARTSTTTVSLHRVGTTTLRASGASSDVTNSGTEISPAGEVDEESARGGSGVSHTPARGVPVVSAGALGAAGPEVVGQIHGLNHRDQRTAGTDEYANTQFSLEPPDQALCVGGGFVLESVNTAIRAFTTTGSPASAPVAISQFLGLTPEIDRANGVFGDFVSDPKCLFDSGHFLFTVLQADTDPATGDFTGGSSVIIAVSATADPTGLWTIYAFDTSNDGDVCPCLGDQPLIGADANGFYVSTNSFPFFADGFNGAEVYAISKAQLESGAPTPTTVHVPVVAPAGFGGTPYSLQPAKTAPGTPNVAGTEYFLSALEFTGSDNRIAQWTLTGTDTLDSGAPSLSLTGTILASEQYAFPPKATQSPDGPFPLRDGAFGPLQQLLYGNVFNGAKYHVELLDTNDDRMNEVVYAGGRLYGALNTAVKSKDGSVRSGIAWFGVDPATRTVATQGYLAVRGAYLMFPAFGVNSAGKGAIGVTVSGPSLHPSTAYALFDGTSFGPVKLSHAGPVGDDGFTGYLAVAGGDKIPSNQLGVARWGDYGATAVADDGSIWLANETTDTDRTVLANWATQLVHLQP